LITQKGRFNDQLEQWNRISNLDPATPDPFVFYGNLMCTMEDRRDKAKFALSPAGLRHVSAIMAKGAQRAVVQDPMASDAMTKNAADASRKVAESLASMSMLLASFPLPGEPQAQVQQGLLELAHLWDELNIAPPGVSDEDLAADDVTKTAAVRVAIKDAIGMLKVSRKPLPCVRYHHYPFSRWLALSLRSMLTIALTLRACVQILDGRRRVSFCRSSKCCSQ
jgi:hypothetical protein